MQTGRADALQAEFGRSGTVNAAVEGGPTAPYAEDLVLGYRVDVRDDATGVWRSLHRRVLATTAERYAPGIPPAPGEGHVQVALAERLTPPGQAPDPVGELYVHEALVSWDGWSLSAPRAGLPLSAHPDAPDPDRPETLPAAVPNDPQTAMGLSFTATVEPGTLPRLRFGRSYRLRLREVDLVGGGLTAAEADQLAVGDVQAEPYLRFEPVAAPAAVPYAAYGEGASLHRLVVRSDAGLDPAAYAARFAAEQPEHPGYSSVDVRHLAPPKASFDLAEKHGRLDLALDSDDAPPSAEQVAVIAGAYEVARREKGSFDDPDAPGAGGRDPHPDRGHRDPVPQRRRDRRDLDRSGPSPRRRGRAAGAGRGGGAPARRRRPSAGSSGPGRGCHLPRRVRRRRAGVRGPRRPRPAAACLARSASGSDDG